MHHGRILDGHVQNLAHAPDYESVHHEGDQHDHAADAASLGGARVLELLLETAHCGGRHPPAHLGYVGGHEHLVRPTQSGDRIDPDVRQRSAPR